MNEVEKMVYAYIEANPKCIKTEIVKALRLKFSRIKVVNAVDYGMDKFWKTTEKEKNAHRLEIIK